MKKLNHLILVITLLLCSCASQLVQTNSIEDLDFELEKYFNDSEISGISLMAIAKGETVYSKDLGYADRDNQTAYDTNTVQNMGSVAKTFLAVALMKAEELDLVDLNEDINEYLPFEVSNPNFPNQAITLQHLATHSSGIQDPDEVYVRSYFFENAGEIDFTQFSKLLEGDFETTLKNNELMDDSEFIEKSFSPEGAWYTEKLYTNKAPGAKYVYTNLGSTLTGYIIEKVSGISYEEFVQEHIIEPLGMQDVYWNYKEVPANMLATKYYNRSTTIPHYHLITKADGSMYTSLFELSKFMVEMRNGMHNMGSLLSPESYKKMFTRYKIGKEYSGIFWEVDEDGVIKHTGSDPGSLAVIGYNPNKDMSYLLSTNCSAEIDKNMLNPLRKMFKTVSNHQF